MNSPATCLLVDDLDENLLALSALLEGAGAKVLKARSASEALELLLVNEVALALIDVQMPEIDGFELAELMRGSERTRRIPIIFVTAASREPWRVFKGYHLGAVDFLYKPIDPLILESKAGVFLELHRQKQQIAEELRQRSETLRLNEMFTGVLGHDLRNPLNAILMSTALLQRRSDDPAIQQIAHKILASGTRMTRMIENMLDLTRARLSGGIPLNRTGADLVSIVERVVQEFRTLYSERTVEVHVEGELTGVWDADRLQQIASNLIGNALQHGDPNGPVIIRLRGIAPDTVTLTVANRGAIEPHVVATIFEPFRSGEGDSRGLGLGLYIAQQIATAHRGSIVVESTPVSGTQFTVTIPRRLAEFVRL
jgi:signal transduction histidine kinase